MRKKLVIIYKIQDSEGSTIAQEFANSLDNVEIGDIVIIKNYPEDNKKSYLS